MEQEFVSSHGGTIAVTHLDDKDSALPHVIWGHGWDQSGAALLPLAESLGRFAFSSLVDFPGFGRSPQPPEVWGTAEYADPGSSSGLGIVLVAGSVCRSRPGIRDCWRGWFWLPRLGSLGGVRFGSECG
jgi:pimeloyl-ACP methyl ester carboxylesterase